MKTLQLQRKRDEAWHYVGPRSDLKEPLVLIFGNRFLLEEAATFEEIRKLFPDGHLVFGSSSGDLIADSVNDEHLSVTAIEFERALFEVKTINISTVAYNSELAGREVVSKLNPNGLKHIFVVSEGSSVNGSALTKGMQAAAPKVLITGGLCGDDARFERTLAGYNKPPDDGEIVVIGFYGESFEASFSLYGGWIPFGPQRVVTRSEGNVLYEIDGKPALDLYRMYLGEKAKELPGSALIYPLNVTSTENNQAFVRTILQIDEKQNAMILAGDVPEQALVQLMMTNIDSLAVASETAALRALEGRTTKPQLALLISCIGRKLVLNQRVEEEVEEVREILGEEVIISGMYSYGEIAPFYGERSCKLHNQTMTITLISE
ncbi:MULTISPECIES: FIST N-terminal domain-containing protein [unclassified Leeuwenhoekiella]|uniref:FIST signal transduction protein n=1 Tax=unclassified Leeuwenhoekiella TaxID=2615029 RepID=UPI000C563032|nr:MULTISPECIES: FIST N-terminal domain-containing protein [unclassified Leeuwenhoekiella]MAW97030.1 histidine kinase [Leeuwenhoekiella sp.]MBA80689.1 histidine kinase [Leeuwenhoekiella sp.]|tara:strand:- start:43336 stop:44466 length:1131 start_codon:yes stop_codon:yes gene_type:complete